MARGREEKENSREVAAAVQNPQILTVRFVLTFSVQGWIPSCTDAAGGKANDSDNRTDEEQH